MTRAEILSEIKRAEEEAKSLVANANEMKDRKITEAHARAREIMKQAEEEAEKLAEVEISLARKTIREEREKIILAGSEEAGGIKKKAAKNITKATAFILTEFERAANA